MAELSHSTTPLLSSTEFIRLAEEDGVSFIRTAAGCYAARNRDGVYVVRGAMSIAEAARLFCEDQGLTLNAGRR